MATGRKLLAKLYAGLPRPAQLRIARAYAGRKERRLARIETPTTVILYVTQRCNARCAHCFYWKELGAKAPELSLDELRTLARSFRHPISLSITGGEPTLRTDLFEVAQAFHELNGCREIKIATNGMLPDRIVDTCRRVLSELGVESLGVQVSIDGPEETHNEVRGVPAFEPAMESARRLKELAEADARFSVHIACCIQKKNIDVLPEFVESLIPLRIPLQFGLIRGESFGTWNLPAGSSSGIDPRDPESPLVPVDRLESFFEWLQARSEESEYPFWSPMQQAKIDLSLRMLRRPTKCMACHAGVIDGVVYANGDVALCELTEPVGNLHDYDLDIARLWSSPAAEEMRAKIRSCFCIHGCNLVTGLMFRPEFIRDAVIQKAKS